LIDFIKYTRTHMVFSPNDVCTLGGRDCPPHFQPDARCAVMSSSRNEFRELAFVTVLLSLLLLTMI